MVTLEQLLNTTTIVRAISRIKTPMSRFQDFYGLGIGGPNTQQIGGKQFSWDIFDRTRSIAAGRAPGTGPAVTSPQIVGNVTARAYRAHEKINLLHERIFRNRPVGGSLGTIDSRGVRYITSQQRYLAQRFKNNREFMVSRMFRGAFQVKIDGDSHTPVDSGGHFNVNFRIPATNVGTVNGIFAGNWNVPGTAVPSDEILNLNAYSEELTGYPIAHAWINSTTFKQLLANDQLRELAGTANVVFSQYERTGMTNEDGIQDSGFTAVFRGIPWLTWHVYDGVLTVDGVSSKFIPDGRAIFTPEPDSAWVEMYEGSEMIKRNVMDGGSEVYGFSAWTTDVIDPAAIELKALDVCLPALYLPSAVFYATVAP